MQSVTVRENDLEGALKVFRKGFDEIRKELKRHEYFECKSVRRKRKSWAAAMRKKKNERKRERFQYVR